MIPFMKRFFILFFTSVVVVTLFNRCEESIEVEQLDALPPGLQLTKIATYEGLVNSAYDRMQAFNYLTQYEMLAPDALADNAVLVNNTGRYVGELVNQAYSHFNYWFLYTAINDCNIVIEYADTITIASQIPRARAAIIQAYFLRAMAYFDMVRVYGYNPNHVVNGWDKGVILRDKPVFDVTQADARSRASLEDTYEFIENDLLTAIDSMAVPGTTIPNQPFRPSLAAMHALLAKVYFNWGKYDLALDRIATVLAVKPASIRLATAAEYENMWVNAAIGSGRVESLFELRIFPGSTGTNGDWNTVDGVNNSLHSLTTTGITNSSQFVLAGSQSLMDAYEANDVRRNLFKNVLVRGRNYNMCMKWPGTSSAPGHWADNIPLLRMSEIYLMRAESYYHEGDEPNARIALNEVRTRRGLPAVDGTVTGVNLFNRILNEWRVEFAFEGKRFYDLKRNGLDIPKPEGDPLLFNDFRILAPIPLSQTILNPQLEQNPGY